MSLIPQERAVELDRYHSQIEDPRLKKEIGDRIREMNYKLGGSAAGTVIGGLATLAFSDETTLAGRLTMVSGVVLGGFAGNYIGKLIHKYKTKTLKGGNL